MKKLLMTTALVAGLGVSAQAQDAATGEMFRAAPDAMEIRASDFIGMRIYTTETEISGDAYEGAQTDWTDIGEINDVLLSRDGMVEAVLVDIGGFLGMGERQVAVNMSSLRMVSDSATTDSESDFFLVMNAAQADLESAPEYTMGAATGTMTGDMATTGAASGGTSDVEAAAAGNTAATSGEATSMSGTATTATDGTMAADGAMATDGTTATDGTASTTIDGTATTGTEGTAATDGMATTATDGTAMATDDTNAPITREGYSAADGEYLTTEKLTGARVYDSADTWIGDVSELVIDDTGKINAAIVDVGGFLGMGAKPVSLTMEDLDIVRNEAGDDVRVYVSYTRDQLDQMETFAN